MHSPSPTAPVRLDTTSLLFLLCFILAQADKQVMGLLSIPLQNAFLLSDTQLGLLQGGAFALAYALGGIPVARLLDSGNRVRIVAICVVLWSIATIACGLATSFMLLIIFRAATAIAEAAVPPAAFSIFSQSGDARAAARLTTNFMLAPYIGGGLVLLLGGALLHIADSGAIAPWRAVFLAVGIPGLLLAPLVAYFGHEPERPRLDPTAPSKPVPTTGQVFRAIFVDSPFLRNYYLGLMTFYVVSAALIAWYPALLVRHFHLSPAQAGGYAGITYLVAGVAGTLSVGLLARLGREMSISSLVRLFCLATTMLTPVVILLPLVSSLTLSLVCYAAYAFLAGAVTSSMAVPIQLSLPNAMQARGTAVASLLMSAVAGSAGPMVVGILSARAILPLSGALAVTGGLCTFAAAALLFRAIQALR